MRSLTAAAHASALSSSQARGGLGEISFEDVKFSDPDFLLWKEQMEKVLKEGGASDGVATQGVGGLQLADFPALLADPLAPVFAPMVRLLAVQMAGRKLWQTLIEKHGLHLLALHHLLPLLEAPPSEGLASKQLHSSLVLLGKFWLVSSGGEWLKIVSDGTPGGTAAVDTLNSVLLSALVSALPILVKNGEPWDVKGLVGAWLGPTVEKGPAAGEVQTRHIGITCDSCKKEIVGVRFKCLQCSGLDLCEACNRDRLVVPYGSRLHSKSHGVEAHAAALPRKVAPVELESLCGIVSLLNTAYSRQSASRNDAALHATSDFICQQPFVEAVLTCLRSAFAFTSSPLLFDLKLSTCTRSCPSTACIQLVQKLAANDSFVEALTADNAFTTFLLRSMCQPASMNECVWHSNSGLQQFFQLFTIFISSRPPPPPLPPQTHFIC